MQLRLQAVVEDQDVGWAELPEATRAAALRLLAGLIGKHLGTAGDNDG